MDRLSERDTHTGSATGPLERGITYGYDKASRELTESDTLGHSLTNNYDAAGRLSSVTTGGPQWPIGVAKTVSFGYDASSNRTQLNWPHETASWISTSPIATTL